MKDDLIAESCRICLRRNIKLRSIYTPLDEGDATPIEMLQSIIGASLDVDDIVECPHSVCKDCALSLNLAYEFRIKACKSQHIIEEYCRQKQLKAKELMSVKLKAANYCDAAENVVVERCSSEDVLIDNTEMAIEELEIDWISGSNDCSDVKHPLLEGADEVALNVRWNEKYLSSEQDMLYNVSATLPSPSDKDENMPQENEVSPDPEGTTESLKKKCGRKLKKKPSRNTSAQLEDCSSGQRVVNYTADRNLHICDVCGNIFAARGRLMEHRRRHDKTETYVCEVCGIHFHIREKLRKHMFSHAGVKPYGCSFCSRTFFYESVKRAHEAIHAGSKPHVCDVCHKAFAYAHSLKTHQLIHTSTKLYHCAYCDKDFRLQHHMKQHVKTLLHLNAVREVTFTANALEA